MSVYARWKALERRHAKRMGGRRLWRPDFSDSKPDGATVADTWDAKYRAKIAVLSWFCEAERKYQQYTAGRRFSLVLHDAGHKGDFVLLKAEDYAALVAVEDVCLGQGCGGGGVRERVESEAIEV